MMAIIILLGLLNCNGLCQTTLPDDPFASWSLEISGVPIVEPPARGYQDFFNQVQYLGKVPLSAEARAAIRLSDQELRALVTVTADLATESQFFRRTWKPLKFESLMETIESGAISPAVQAKLRDLQNQWERTIADHVQRLKAALGEERFQRVDEFVHSGKSMFAK
jgi:hypothetical protein